MKTVLLLLIFGALLCGDAVAAETRPNIVVILADDMGFSDLSCYGGEIDTPHLDALAGDGLRYTRFYNAARCCPTRAALLTGLYPHQAGIGHMTGNDGIPSYQGYLNDHCLTLAEALGSAGYRTLAAGKWHVGSAPGQWPLDRGFDRYWGTPAGGGVYFKDTLQIRKTVFFVEGEERVALPEGFYVTDGLTTHAIDFVKEAGSGQERPFFLYLPHIAPHWPLQAKADDIAKYRGLYDDGWDKTRMRRFDRQREMGIVPVECQISPRDKRARAWSDVPEAERRDLAHRMEVYAAQVDCLDQNVGRLVAALKELGEFENTLILFLSDNGCSAEGGPGGFSRGREGAEIGTGLSYASVGLEWANVCDTPYRKFKMDTHEGGIATPLIAHWPAGISAHGELRHQPGHVIDIMPTLLDVAGASYPKRFQGETLTRLEGHSLVPTFTNRDVDRDALYWEHEGNKAIRKGDWKAVAGFGQSWGLYNLKNDRTERNNLARRYPERTRELAADWREWADRCGVWDWNALKNHRRERKNANQEAN